MVFVWFLDVVGRYLVLLTPLSHHPLVELQSEVANQPEPHTGRTISMLVCILNAYPVNQHGNGKSMKIPIFNREYIFNRSIFHCHVSLLEGI